MSADLSDILQTWNDKAKELFAFTDGNCLLVAERTKELVAFLRTSEPVLRSWMNAYLSRNRNNIFVKSYSSIVQELTKDLRFKCRMASPQYASIKEQWDSVFGKSPAYCFELMEKVVLNAENRLPQLSNKIGEHCDDLTIVALHEGRSCIEGDWWDNDCFLCYTQYDEWKKELIRRVHQSQHPLLNSKKSYFWALNDCFDECPIAADWTPPRRYSIEGGYDYCYDIQKYISFMKAKMSESFGAKGLAPGAACSEFLHRLDRNVLIGPPKSDLEEYDIFQLLWHRLDVIHEAYDLVLERASEIESMF